MLATGLSLHSPGTTFANDECCVLLKERFDPLVNDTDSMNIHTWFLASFATYTKYMHFVFPQNQIFDNPDLDG